MLHLDAQPPVPLPKPKRMWAKPWIMERDDKGAYSTIMTDLYKTDMPSFRN